MEENDANVWDGVERRRVPHPYEIVQHMDLRIAELRTELLLLQAEVKNVAKRLEAAETTISSTRDLIKEGAGMRRLLGYIVIGSALVWGAVEWLKGHFHW